MQTRYVSAWLDFTEQREAEAASKPERLFLAADYGRVLGAYIESGDEAELGVASDLGCVAMRRGMGIFDLVRLHEAACTAVGSSGASRAAMAQRSQAAREFLLAALLPFEAALRRLPITQARVACLELALASRGQAFAGLLPHPLHKEMALRCHKAHTLKLCREIRTLKAEIQTHPDKLVQVHEAERKRMSRELHDELGQLLVALSVNLATLKKEAGTAVELHRRVDGAQTLVVQSLESVRRICRNLRADALDRLGLHAAIALYLRSFTEAAGIMGVMADKVDLTGLGTEQEVVLYRIVQESITNVIKHAHATRVAVHFKRCPRDVYIEIEDDGCAFNVEEVLAASRGQRLGLQGMRERVQLMRGDLTIESVVGRGTRVRVRLPLAAHASYVAQGRRHRLSENQLKLTFGETII